MIELIDSIYVAADTTSVSFGLGGDGVNNAEIDGDVDKHYEIIHHWAAPEVNDVKIQLVPNQLSTPITASQYTYWLYANTAYNAAALVFARSNWTIGGTVKPFSDGKLTLNSATGKNRMFTAEDCFGRGNLESSLTLSQGEYSGVWADTATKITSLGIVTTTALGIKIGSEFHLYKRSVAV